MSVLENQLPNCEPNSACVIEWSKSSINLDTDASGFNKSSSRSISCWISLAIIECNIVTFGGRVVEGNKKGMACHPFLCIVPTSDYQMMHTGS